MTSRSIPFPVPLRSALVLVAVFLAGGVAGAGAIRAAPAPGHGELPPFPYREIGLTSSQEAQVHEILVRNKPRMDQILEETVPRVRALAEDVESQIVAVLSPEQRQRYITYKAGRPPPLPAWTRPPAEQAPH